MIFVLGHDYLCDEFCVEEIKRWMSLFLLIENDFVTIGTKTINNTCLLAFLLYTWNLHFC